MYVADYSGRQVWKYAPGATTPTWSASVQRPFGPVVDGAGNLFVACQGSVICEIPAAATTASPSAIVLNNDQIGDEITGVAVDGQGNLYGLDCCFDEGVVACCNINCLVTTSRQRWLWTGRATCSWRTLMQAQFTKCRLTGASQP